MGYMRISIISKFASVIRPRKLNPIFLPFYLPINKKRVYNEGFPGSFLRETLFFLGLLAGAAGID